jgi:hypothetical protein
VSTGSVLPTVCVLWTDKNATPMSYQVTASIPAPAIGWFAQSTLLIDNKNNTAVDIATGTNCPSGTAYTVGSGTLKFKIRARIEAN